MTKHFGSVVIGQTDFYLALNYLVNTRLKIQILFFLDVKLFG